MSHPAFRDLEALAHGLLEAPETVEIHVAACPECGWAVAKLGIEHRRMSEALQTDAPAALYSRILEAGPRRRFPVSLTAAALMLVLVTALSFRDRPNLGPVALLASHHEEAWVLPDLCRVEVERGIAELRLRDDERDEILAATSTTAEVFERAVRGEIDMEELLRTDTLAGLRLDCEALDRRRRIAAEQAADAIVNDLEPAVGLGAAQKTRIVEILVEGSAWRRDIAFLPEFVRRHLCAHLLMQGEVRTVLDEDQARALDAFLDREAQGYRRLWERLKEKKA